MSWFAFFGVIFILWCLYGSICDTRRPFRHAAKRFGLLKRPPPEYKNRFDLE